MEMRNQVAENLENYFEMVKRRYLDYMHRMGYEKQIRDKELKLNMSKGKRYAKVNIGGSVHSFVDLNNGNVYKAASWRAPAKHARGNVLSKEHGEEAIDKRGYHIFYMR